MWRRNPKGDTRNPEEVRDAILQSVLSQDHWIIEGVHHRWLVDSFKQADAIIYLDPPVRKRSRRIVSRFIKQRLGLEAGNYMLSFSHLLQLMKWNRDFDRKIRPDIFRVLESYKSKLILLEDNSYFEPYLAQWSANRPLVLAEAARRAEE